LCNFVAIAQGQCRRRAGSPSAACSPAGGGEPVLLSWSGSMFEYLMPLLVMPTYDNTLLDQTCKAAVARQIEYGRQRGVPGAFRNPATTRSTCISTTSTAPSASPGWDSSAGWPTIW
jgi:hypothetical protein